MKKCKNCDNDSFVVDEYIVHKAMLQDGILESYKTQGCGIESIFCDKCQAEYTHSDFNIINL